MCHTASNDYGDCQNACCYVQYLRPDVVTAVVFVHGAYVRSNNDYNDDAQLRVFKDRLFCIMICLFWVL